MHTPNTNNNNSHGGSTAAGPSSMHHHHHHHPRVLLSCGANGNGQLGIGNSEVALIPEFVQVGIPSGEEIHFVTCGSYHTVGIMRSGKVYTWGMNKNGQLGHSTDSVVTQSLPLRLKVPAPSGTSTQHMTRDGDLKFIKAAAGESHTILLSITGEVYTLGSNSVGQLGRMTENTFDIQAKPIDLSSTTLAAVRGRVICSNVFAGPSTSFAVTPDGHLLGWGASSTCELGFQQGIVPTPRLITLPSSLHHSYKVVRVSAGVAHTLLLTSTGEVFVSGENTDGQLGVTGSIVPTWRAVKHARNLRTVATNSQQSFFLTSIGILSQCGTSAVSGGSNPQQGLLTQGGGGLSPLPPPAGGGPNSSVLHPPSSSNSSTAPDLVYDLKDVECDGVAAGGQSSVLAWSSSEGAIYARGRNHRGQLGLGHISAVTGSFAKLDRRTIEAGLSSRSSKQHSPKLGKLHMVCAGRAHTVAIFSIAGSGGATGGGADAETILSDGVLSRSLTPQHGGSGADGGTNPLVHGSDLFASADELDQQHHHDSSDTFDHSGANESFSRSCVDDVMNVSFSRTKAPALSFAAANKSMGQSTHIMVPAAGTTPSKSSTASTTGGRSLSVYPGAESPLSERQQSPRTPPTKRGASSSANQPPTAEVVTPPALVSTSNLLLFISIVGVVAGGTVWLARRK